MESKNGKGDMNATDIIEKYLIYEENFERSEDCATPGEFSIEHMGEQVEFWVCNYTGFTIFIRQLNQSDFLFARYSDLWWYVNLNMADPRFFDHFHNIIDGNTSGLDWKPADQFEDIIPE